VFHIPGEPPETEDSRVYFSLSSTFGLFQSSIVAGRPFNRRKNPNVDDREKYTPEKYPIPGRVTNHPWTRVSSFESIQERGQSSEWSPCVSEVFKLRKVGFVLKSVLFCPVSRLTLSYLPGKSDHDWSICDLDISIILIETS
jgi:hypothetical protein